MTQEELNKALELHKKWLNHEPGGVQADLRGCDLREAKLIGADLRGADLRWSKLIGADLSEAKLREAKLRGANLSEADLRRSKLIGADLREADLHWSKLIEADLSGGNLSGAKLIGADLSEAKLRGADLSGANLSEADLRWVGLRGANMIGVNLDYSCWPLWCGSKDVKVDKRIAAQLAYHFCWLDCDDVDYLKARNAILFLANQCHRVGECGTLKPHPYPLFENDRGGTE